VFVSWGKGMKRVGMISFLMDPLFAEGWVTTVCSIALFPYQKNTGSFSVRTKPYISDFSS